MQLNRTVLKARPTGTALANTINVPEPHRVLPALSTTIATTMDSSTDAARLRVSHPHEIIITVNRAIIILGYTCSLQSDSGVMCGAGTSFRYFYNSQTKECQNFQFLGCDGNSNNFPSLSDCEEYCDVGGRLHV